MKYKKYTNNEKYAYSFGVYPTIELIKNKSSEIKEILLSEKGNTNEGIKIILDLCSKNKISYRYSEKEISKLSDKDNILSIGIFNKFSSSLNRNKNHIILVSPMDAGNLGTIIRTMQGFDQSQLAIIKPAVDIFNPKVIRASMGSVFSIGFEHFDSIVDYRKKFSSHNMILFMTDGHKNIKDVNKKTLYSLVFGNESRGLSNDYKEVGESVFISSSRNIDSLNLSIAAGIAMYEFYKPD